MTPLEFLALYALAAFCGGVMGWTLQIPRIESLTIENEKVFDCWWDAEKTIRELEAKLSRIQQKRAANGRFLKTGEKI